ncbi:aldo/keto reductase [Gilliamella sp. CG16]|uniref:aldo/keto reductase n=1 Tax=Gilliamella sp. CG16 TaxID=3351503 RepID=UPI003987576A
MHKLPQRALGSDISVSAIGYGAMGLSEFYGPTDDQHSIRLLHSVVDSGITLIDTADMYGRGQNELLIGTLLKELTSSQREQLCIATKCGIDRSNTIGYERKINNAPQYIKSCCEASLKRLGIEQIDLFYIHRINPENPIEETMETMATLVKEGKIKHVGLCEVPKDLLIRAHSVFPVDVVQTEYSLWTRDIEDNLLPLLKELNIGLVPYSPLGRGFLTGKYQSGKDFADGDFRKTNPRFLDANIEHNKLLLNALKPMTIKYDCTSGQIALAWLLAQWEGVVPIPGTKQEKYLFENVNACFVTLEKEDLTILNDLKNRIDIKGDRYTPEGMKGIF